MTRLRSIHDKPQRAWPPRYPLDNTPASRPSRLADVVAKVPAFGQGRAVEGGGHRDFIPGPALDCSPIRRRPIRNALANFFTLSVNPVEIVRASDA